jgi:tRNA (mo5U34)-methyltransferase
MACAEAMLRSAGFEIIDHPEVEVFICKRSERKPPADDEKEFLVRCGRG